MCSYVYMCLSKFKSGAALLKFSDFFVLVATLKFYKCHILL